MSDVVIIGGGVIGLSLAYELSVEGVRDVTLLERRTLGREASWAGAGILTPAGAEARAPIDRLRALSLRRVAEWSARLRDETGIDNGYRPWGELQLATDAETASALRVKADAWRADGLAVEPLTGDELAQLEPRLASDLTAAYRLPEGAQLRNPWHLRALAAACARRGVRLLTGTPATGFDVEGGRVTAVRTPAGRLAGERFVVAAGAWSPALLRGAGLTVPGEPVRGQIVLLDTPVAPLRHVVWAGSRYLVPRPEGRVLVGSTEDHAGFESHPTAGGVASLLALAHRLVPELAEARFDRAWAGLRPGSPDALPILGRAPGRDNLYLATGHFRSGFELSAGSAVLLGQLLRGEAPEQSLEPFRAERFVSS